MAVNRRFAREGQQTADFINCVAWRQTAEFISKIFYKKAE
ncbi:MAG: single-stranded DNA-binding protein [Clostridiales bacterium]|nr:MAG: single-stranded DNA-binding protein [Clostridiales bacterium]